MTRLLVIILGFLVLPLVSSANPVVVSATGWGSTEFAAIASAKRQAIIDAEAAGFLIRDGYRSGTTKVLEIRRSNDSYMARVDIEIAKSISSKRFLLLKDGDDQQIPGLTAVIERARRALAEKQLDKENYVELVDIKVPANLIGWNLTNLQSANLEFELNKLVRDYQVDAIYLLRKYEEYTPYFLVKLKKDGETERSIRTFRLEKVNDSISLTEQIANALYIDANGKMATGNIQSAVTVQANGVTVHKGQRVFIYTTSLNEKALVETTILTNGIVTEVIGSKVRVLTELPVNSIPTKKMRLSPLTNRGIIKESDW